MGKWRYGVVLDAGSSGTRVHIYRWLKSDKALEKAKDKQLHSLPAIETDSDWTKKTHPGISTFGENPYDVGPEHLDKLISHALKKIPLDEVPNTPLFLLATAGMRILPPAQRKAVLSEVCDFVKKTTKFQLPDCDLHVQVIPGETEGLYGWIAANYLLGGFDQLHPHDHGKKHSTYGFLDMGGASAQIAFAPNSTEAEKHANDLTLLRLRTIDGTPLEYKVFVTTWLGFGVNRARQRYVQALVEASPKAKELPDPCMPSGLSVTVSKDGKVLDEDSEEGKGNEPQLVGTGDFAACLRQTYPLLEKDKKCLDEPCLLNGQHVPAIDFDVNHFVGVSEYWYTTHEMFGIGDKNKNKAYDLKTYQEGVEEFCTESWEDIEKGVKDHKWGKKFKESKAMEACFKASWLINMLHDGIGVPRVGLEELKGSTNTTDRLLDKAKEKGFLDPFQAVDTINGYEVSWTLGKMVLYASSEVQLPSENALPVGYGSNVVGATGIPKDFQYPGGSYKSYSSSKGDDDDDWREHLFDENPRRIPGFLLFLLIIFVIGFFSCGRERRKSVGQKVGRIFGRGSSFGGHRGGRRRGLAGKLFGMNSGPSYERVLEDGEAAEDFELGSFTDSDNEHSDSSDGSRLGRTSGWATPQNKVDQGPLPLLGAGEGGSGRDVMAQGSSLGLGPPAAYGNAIDRGGLMSRTDSRERLHNNGSRSGANSPKRIRSPMSRLTE